VSSVGTLGRHPELLTGPARWRRSQLPQSTGPCIHASSLVPGVPLPGVGRSHNSLEPHCRGCPRAPLALPYPPSFVFVLWEQGGGGASLWRGLAALLEAAASTHPARLPSSAIALRSERPARLCFLSCCRGGAFRGHWPGGLAESAFARGGGCARGAWRRPTDTRAAAWCRSRWRRPAAVGWRRWHGSKISTVAAAAAVAAAAWGGGGAAGAPGGRLGRGAAGGCVRGWGGGGGRGGGGGGCVEATRWRLGRVAADCCLRGLGWRRASRRCWSGVPAAPRRRPAPLAADCGVRLGCGCGWRLAALFTTGVPRGVRGVAPLYQLPLWPGAHAPASRDSSFPSG